MITTVYRVGMPCNDTGEAIDMARDYQVLFGMFSQDASRYLLAHELGHALGLGHELCTGTSPTNLMCPYTKQLNDKVSPAFCATARKRAAELASAYWGVVVSP